MSTFTTIARHLALLFEPLTNGLSSEDEFRALCFRLGYEVSTIPPSYTALRAVVDAVVSAAHAETPDGEVIATTLRALHDALGSSLTAPDGSTDVDAGIRLIELLLSDYLATTLPSVRAILVGAGIIVVTHRPASGDRPAFDEVRFDYDAIPRFLSDPTSVAQGVWKWGGADFLFSALIDWLLGFTVARGFRAYIAGPDPDLYQAYRGPQGAEDRDRSLNVSFIDTIGPSGPVEAGIQMLFAPGATPGLVLQPLLPSQLELDLGGDFKVEARTDVAKTFGIIIRPGADLEVKYPFDGGSELPTADLALTFSPASPRVLIGSEGATRLEIRGATTSATVKPFSATALELVVEILTVGLKLVVQPGDGDGFISKILGSTDEEVPFDLGIRWSSRTGLTFAGSGKLELTVKTDLSIGPIQVEQVSVALFGRDKAGSEPPALVAEIGVDVSGSLGPVEVALDRVGVALDFAFGKGTVGPYDLSVGFKPPRGAGLDIDAGPISGGGFISLDPDAGRYSGGLELRIFEITVQAFGVIDTKLPGGKKGFSFVIIISAVFQPIQLGLGFTLNGVGGILGINRTLSEEALDRALANRDIETLLFPTDVVQDAPQIIQALQTVFPPAEDHQVFGPMAKIGWGTPTLVTADLALVLALPDRVLTLLGLVNAQLPKKEGDDSPALVDLHMFIKGVLNFPEKLFSLDASLHDSTVAGFNVSGQMAMRLLWGDRPKFLLSLGGFHPSYQPPPDIPRLERLKIDLGISGNPTITLAGYLAITSNSVQVGGQLDFVASGFGFNLGASVSADAIFIFSPFSFAATIQADVHVSFHGVGFTVGMHGMLTGPSPWQVDAKVCASLWFVSACLPIRVTIGDRAPESLPSLDPWLGSREPEGTPKAVVGLKAALEDPRNWTPLPGAGTLASISRVEAPHGASTPTLVDPLDAITVRQRAVPLETTAPITRFGAAKSSGTPHFRLKQAQLRDHPEQPLGQQANINDQFAPGQYFDLNQTKTLSAPSFERHTAGYTLNVSAELLAGSKETTGPFKYQTFVVDSKRPRPRSDLDLFLASSLLDGQLAVGPAAISGLVRKGASAFVDPLAPPRFGFKDPGYGITDRSTNNPVATVLASPVSRTQALVILENHLASNPGDRGTLQVSRVGSLP